MKALTLIGIIIFFIFLVAYLPHQRDRENRSTKKNGHLSAKKMANEPSIPISDPEMNIVDQEKEPAIKKNDLVFNGNYDMLIQGQDDLRDDIDEPDVETSGTGANVNGIGKKTEDGKEFFFLELEKMYATIENNTAKAFRKSTYIYRLVVDILYIFLIFLMLLSLCVTFALCF